MSEKKIIDWETLSVHYRAGVRSLKDMGLQFGVSDAAIIKKARKEGWTRDLLTKPVQRIERADDKSKPGYIYVLQLLDTAGNPFYKIGMALSAEQRISSHQGSSPFKLEIAVSYYVGNMRREESVLHSMFDAQRVRGEWFTLSGDDLDTIALRARLV